MVTVCVLYWGQKGIAKHVLTSPPPPTPQKKKENNTNILYCLLYDAGGFLVIIWFDNVYKLLTISRS